MQLYALDKDKRAVFANHAKKHTDYTCPECSSLLRLRGGIHRQNHFYHLDVERRCRQNGKSMEHLLAQFRILETLPEDECSLEVRFPEIQRIADCVWHKHKVIFEIQCSPISAAEVRSRNTDYRKMGYSVIWILHDKQFGMKKPSAAEIYLASQVHYFTNIDAWGKGNFYDQFTLIEGLNRKYVSKKRECIFKELVHHEGSPKLTRRVPWLLQEKMKNSVCHFKGDWTDACLQGESKELLEKLLQFEKKSKGGLPQKIVGGIVKLIRNYIVRPYRTAFRIFLEKACM